ncbi:MAG: hemerythrin domain-containing protein [Proteobacteria bacterium]|nr:hemerythrin domain-containing protein [Pseudomonadota bacterium]
MHSILGCLGQDHRHIDERWSVLRQDMQAGLRQNALKGLNQIVCQLSCHIEAEEQILFPAFERRQGSGSGPTAVMRLEHERIRAALEQMRQMLETADPLTGDEAVFSAFSELMGQHNAKEEHILYPLCDALLGPEKEDILQALKERLGCPA